VTAENRHPESSSHRQQDRAGIQRNRILAAAQTCFIERGFHAASMAEIAAHAGMSPGLIYRYFASKSAIIQAIVERQNEEVRADIASLRSACDLITRIVDLFARWKQHDPRVMNPVLFLEMTAESGRDPQIARALDEAQRIRGGDFRAWIRQAAAQAGRELGDEEVRIRAFSLQCFIEGLAVRAVREPDVEREVLVQSLKLFLPQILPFPGQQPTAAPSAGT
jgi:AcrR family transcriptional regulator